MFRNNSHFKNQQATGPGHAPVPVWLARIPATARLSEFSKGRTKMKTRHLGCCFSFDGTPFGLVLKGHQKDTTFFFGGGGGGT